MAIHTGGNQRSGGHAGVATSDDAASTTKINGKDVPQFAPNFSVYAMPPDAVCFYSEDRKFVLHGELFCALAGIIGTGKKSFAQIARELSNKYPADVVDEALKGLIDRRYIVAKRPSSSDAAAAYWATLGLPLDMADKNLKACRVRVQSLDAKGGKELRRGIEKTRRSRRRPRRRSHRRIDQRLSRRRARCVEQAAPGRPHAVVARASLRRFPAGRPGVSAGRRPVLDLSRRTHETKSRSAGDARSPAGAPGRGIAARPRFRRRQRPATRRGRNRQGDRHRAAHAAERSSDQP